VKISAVLSVDGGALKINYLKTLELSGFCDKWLFSGLPGYGRSYTLYFVDLLYPGNRPSRPYIFHAHTADPLYLGNRPSRLCIFLAYTYGV